MKTICAITIFSLFAVFSAKAQVGVNTSNPDSSAALDIQSPSGGSDIRGVLFPRMTTTQRLSIAQPATSLFVFDTDDMLFYYYDGSRWIGLVPKEPSGTSGPGAPHVNGDITLTTGTIKAPNLNSTTVTTTTATATTTNTTTLVVPGFANNALVPTGVIVMWSGNPNALPTGWALCDGLGGRPNLKGQFIVGYNSSDPDYSTIGNTSGSKLITLDKTNLPAHQHTISTTSTDGGSISVSGGNHDHSSQGSDILDTDNGEIITPTFSGQGSNYSMTIGDGAHGHNISGNTGDGTSDNLNAVPVDNRPPYYVLAYIIKL